MEDKLNFFFFKEVISRPLKKKSYKADINVS